MASQELFEETRVTANLAQILSPEENTYTTSEKRIPMPDGIELAADFY